jgi:hypothetical protein
MHVTSVSFRVSLPGEPPMRFQAKGNEFRLTNFKIIMFIYVFVTSSPILREEHRLSVPSRNRVKSKVIPVLN